MANLKEERKLMNAISEALKYRKNHPNADNSEVTKSVLKLIQAERAEKTKLRIVASVSKILDIAEKTQNSLTNK